MRYSEILKLPTENGFKFAIGNNDDLLRLPNGLTFVLFLWLMLKK